MRKTTARSSPIQVAVPVMPTTPHQILSIALHFAQAQVPLLKTNICRHQCLSSIITHCIIIFHHNNSQPPSVHQVVTTSIQLAGIHPDCPTWYRRHPTQISVRNQQVSPLPHLRCLTAQVQLVSFPRSPHLPPPRPCHQPLHRPCQCQQSVYPHISTSNHRPFLPLSPPLILLRVTQTIDLPSLSLIIPQGLRQGAVL